MGYRNLQEKLENVLTRPIKSLCTLFSLFLLFELWPEPLNFIQKLQCLAFFKVMPLPFTGQKKRFRTGPNSFTKTSFYYLEPTDRLLLANIIIFHLFRMKNSLAIFGQKFKI